MWRNDDGRARACPGLCPRAWTAGNTGARAQEHRAAGPVTLQCLEGTLRLHHAGHPLELGAGEMVVLDAGIPHSHEALTDCAVLLTLTSAEQVQHVQQAE